MSPLLKIRAERDQMSAIERRIADFIVENAHLLRDYSSQQLANALKISQSSVVKFSQKLGFKGYPDLKYSIGESVARGDAGEVNGNGEPGPDNPHDALADELWQAKARAEQETRLINPPPELDAIATAIGKAGKVFMIGFGEDGIPARAFALRLAMLDIVALHHFDAALMTAGIATVQPDDVLLAFSEFGQQPAFGRIVREFRERQGKVVSVTRHTANPLRARADLALLVSAHDDKPHMEPLLYQCALRHLLDVVFVLLCEDGGERLARYEVNRERMLNVLEP